jgi:hypothetical protein
MSHLESRDVGSFDDRIGDRPPAVSASTIARRQICLNQPVTGSAIFLKAPGGSAKLTKTLTFSVSWIGRLTSYIIVAPGQRFP